MKQETRVLTYFGFITRRRISNAPEVFEEISGLDDIFPGTAQGTTTEKAKHLSLVGAKTTVVESPINEEPIPLQTGEESVETLFDSCDYMLKNNRILSNSIANLAENYFKQQEAASSN